MASVHRKLRQALGAVKDQTSIGLARVSSNIGIPDLEVAIVKATSHDPVPMDEKYVHEILFLVSNTPGSVSALAMGLAKRFDRTHNWIVALKGLMLIHRLLRGGDRYFEEELRLSRAKGLLNLNLSNFRDHSSSNSWDFTAFLRSYSQFLDERMDWSITPSGKLENASGYGVCEEIHSNSKLPGEEVKTTEKKILELVLDRLPKSQRLLDRVIACRPTGLAKSNRLVQIALNSVVRESFQLYANVCDGIASLIDTFFDMQYQHCVVAFEIYKKAASQSHELLMFFEKCKEMNVCGSFEYPTVERINQEHVDTLEEFMNNRSQVPSAKTMPEFSSYYFIPEEASAPKSESVACDFVPRRRSFGFGSHSSSQALGTFSESKFENHQTSFRSPYRDSHKYRNNNPQNIEYTDSKLYKARSTTSAFTPAVNKQKLGLRSELRTVPSEKNFVSDKPKKQEENADLLQIENAPISAEEHDNRLALALFSTRSQTKISTTWENFNSNSDHQTLKSVSSSGKPSWELALVSSAPAPAPAPATTNATTISSMSGQFDNLLLDSLYDQAETTKKISYSDAPSEDPFAASANIPPPAYVQIDEMKKKQGSLLQEQQLWQQYQNEGMHGYCGFVQLYNNPSCGPGSSMSSNPNLMSYGIPASTLPQYNMGGFAFTQNAFF
eukprot:Gb_31324 [translate_table: standard]